MAYDTTARMLAIKAIGTVESGLNYLSINYGDPITVGFMQWYGTRASALLRRMRDENPSAWVGVDPTLDADLTAHADSESSYWTSRYLTRAEGESLIPVLNANKSIQNTVAIEDIDNYLPIAQSIGMNENSNTPAVLFFFVAYHQSPRRALAVVRDAGPDSDIDRLYAATLNESVLGNYRTRYTTARDIIKSGDTSGIEIDPGDTPPPSPDGGDNGGGSVIVANGPVVYVSRQGDALHIHLKGGGIVRAYTTGNDLWQPRRDPSTGAVVPDPEPNPDPEVPPTGDVAAKRAALVDFVTSRIDRYAYSQGASRLNPEANMYTDCSGLMYYTFQQVLGIDIGTYTGDQYTQGTLVAEGSGTLDESLLAPGDLVFYDWTGGRSTVDHVDMYIGGSNVCGHGGPGSGPNTKALAPRISAAVKYFVRRHV